MKTNQWTLGLAAAGLVTLPAGLCADEPQLHPVQSAVQSTTLSGYVNASMHWNLGTGNANNPAYSYGSGKADGFNLDAVNLTLQKPLDEASWAAGYTVDLLFGPDANAYATSSVLGANDSDFAIKQANVVLRAPVGNGLDFKVGVFDTIIGYEVFHAGNNPNYTRSYGFTIEPTTHTGVLMTYQVCEGFSASAGVANTTGAAINERAFGNTGNNNKAESYKTYMGSVTFTAPESLGFLGGSVLYAGIVNGFGPSALGSSGEGAVNTSYYVGATVNTPVEALKVGAAFDYYNVDDQNLATDINSGWAWSAAGYVSYQLSEKLKLHGRGEYFSQTDSWAVSGLPDKVISGTATLDYSLWANALTRLEFRWDHSAGDFGVAYGENSVGAADLKNAYLVALNVIYSF
ncbi:MAG TPA: outer membrane beta-barrel protein [Methylomirabilota bacterium]|nr:outer membrane beta-barrel protein [Methylomirabilota bacterium]